MHRALRLGWRFVMVALADGLSLLAAVIIMPGIAIREEPLYIVAAILSAMLIGLANALIRPALVYLTYPVNLLTVGIPTILLDSVLLLLMGNVLPGFRVDEFWPSALIGAIILSVSNIILTTLTDPERQRTLYDYVLHRLGRASTPAAKPAVRRGMIFVQIDGLSYTSLREALRLGRLPTVHRILDAGGHATIAWDCGLPSQTSSSQAGIMYGDNFDIPAFRWYDRELKRVLTSNWPEGARTIEQRNATNPGLLRGGSSINNLISGSALSNIFTVSTANDAGRQSSRIEDFLLFLLNPYSMLRVFGLAAWDLLMEFLGAWRQRWRRAKPRIPRQGLYLVFRLVSNVILREISTYCVLLDIMRGTPYIYVNYLGYDEVSHFAGPHSPDIAEPLIGIDNQIRHILKIMQRDAPITYDLIILSDHGQTESVPFRQRYGEELGDVVQRLIAGEVPVTAGIAEREVPGQLVALLEELREAERISPGRLVPLAMNRSRRALDRYSGPSADSGARDTTVLDPATETPDPDKREVLVLYSGNLAHVYFRHHEGPLSLEAIESQHPQLTVDLARHPGIGFIVGRSEMRGPLAIGPEGFRELETGLVVGNDPFTPFGDPNHIAGQVLRLMRFPNSGDLVINSSYSEGRVVAFERQVGAHGGLGGAQTQPFLIYPADMRIDPATITNAVDLYPIFNARRDADGGAKEPSPEGRSEITLQDLPTP